MNATAPGFDAEKAAQALWDARARRQHLLPLPLGVAPRTVAEGAAAQLALAGLGGNIPPGGFKIGATAKRMQDYLGLTGPGAFGRRPACSLAARHCVSPISSSRELSARLW